MTANATTINHGSVGATQISSALTSAGLATTQYVTLSGNYARLIPPGYPEPNAGAPAGTSKTAAPQTIASGARVKFFAHEAQALITAGAGVAS